MVMSTHVQKVKTAKKVQKRERRETLQREAQQTERASEQAAHRLAGMRSRGESAHKDRSRQKSAPAPKMESLDTYVSLICALQAVKDANAVHGCICFMPSVTNTQCLVELCVKCKAKRAHWVNVC